MLYRITIEGDIGDHIDAVFPHLTTTQAGRHHHIVGDIRDQTQLHGVLALIRDLDVTIVALTRLEGERPE